MCGLARKLTAARAMALCDAHQDGRMRTPAGVRICIAALSAALASFLAPFPALGGSWGEIMVATSDTNILAARSSKAKIRARLKAGRRVKVDFLKAGWYAVFPPDENVRSMKRALGYVPARRLRPAGRLPHASAKPAASRAPAARRHPPPDAGAEAKAAADRLTGRGAPAQSSNREGAMPEAHAPADPVDAAYGGEGIVLRGITFKIGRGHERVFIAFNGKILPELSSIQNELPRVVADFQNVAAVRPGLKHIEVGGSFIKRVRSSYNAATRVLRIVLDLDMAKNYLVNQVFSEKENMYVFDVAEDPENPVR